MTSQLVADVRALITQRADNGRPMTMPERALILATVLPRRGNTAGVDVVDELEAAITHGRRVLFADPGLAPDSRDAVRRLLAAARAILEHTPADDEPVLTSTGPARPFRADIDG